jgi:PAS domain S-box-containing protein
MRKTPREHAQDVIFDSIAEGVFTVDSDWTITTFNRAAERITGFPRAEAIGQKCFELFQADTCSSSCALREAMETGRERVAQRITIRNRRGERIPVSVSAAALHDENDRIVGGVETFRDLAPVEAFGKTIDQHDTFHDIISTNHEVRRILDILPDIAGSDSTVLIEGPTGSGKELFAKAIHHLSGRAGGRYVVVNCGALPDAMLESQLFGRTKGALSDGPEDAPGCFAMAEGGTLFLDEIGDISTTLQGKLLRVLQEREYEPLGATTTTKANVRVITATTRSLADRVARGAFREDLFYRLNVVKIVLPPLARRREDIPLLADRFIRQISTQQGKQIRGITEEALGVLLSCEFPGNVRQLRNVIEHAVVLCRGEQIEVECLPAELLNTFGGCVTRDMTREEGAAAGPLPEAEATAILRMLRQHGGHRGKTAEALGIDKTTLWRKMKKYGITYT